ncbi:sugar phosphate isomerase/epimerase family protein [Paenibacillus koleovorans]|uniref:sugar phosphate isomerase/epimerase family protein n=1 Tax=Paenibacillus koleovorans TaxID=121608 RepID=UPI000FDCBEFB|nr:sugar phosphate isomerase/epimerase [Paenibacillus koleovorans]
MKIGIADFGMNVWDGGFYDYEERWKGLREIGYEGIERLTAFSSDEALSKAARMRKDGMSFATVRGPSLELSIQWTAGLGKPYVWTQVSEQKKTEVFYRQVNLMSEACRRAGIQSALHNHMGSLVESQEELETFLHRCPETKLVFDIGHFVAAEGDCIEIIRKYGERIEVIHIKDWLLENPSAEAWNRRGRFCGLGQGNMGLDVKAILDQAAHIGFDGWVFVEHDSHLQEPLDDLRASREYLHRAGY